MINLPSGYVKIAIENGVLMGYMMVIQWDLMGYVMVYPLVMTNIAIENGHRNSGFTH